MKAALLAVAGGLLLGLATPPAALPLGEWLVLPALMWWYALATAAPRPLRSGYLFGCAHAAWFSWSVSHLMWIAYALIVVAAGLYYLLANAVTRAVPRRLGPLGFAVAVAGTFWLRAMMPEIHYPHGQPCHCLWQWPLLLGSVALGGEPLANALLAGIAATAVEVARSWRVAIPPWGAAWRSFAIAVAAAVVATVWGAWVNAAAQGPVSEPPVRVVAIEPGWHPEEFRFAATEAEWRALYDELLRSRLVEPTRLELAREPVADLILWPESSVYGKADVADVDAGRVRLDTWRLPASPARLVLGSEVRYPAGDCPAALLVELPGGRVLGHHDKQRLVPGGEFLPLVGLLPEAVANWLGGLFERALGTPPDVVPGGPRAPLQTAAGVPFGAMLCYDNAFPGPAAEQVARGARVLVVLSNEAWYRGGGELVQLVAMTVMRALETATPIARCTLDGWSVAVDGRGRLLDGLDLRPAPQPEARILRVSLPPGRGQEPPMAWLRRVCGPVLAALCALAAAHALWRWVRLRSAPTAVPVAAGPGAPGRRGGGS